RKSANNLTQIGIALHTYHDTHEAFPTAASYGKDGKPLLSWRGAILPYIEQVNLYQQVKLDQPWGTEHNRALVQYMPDIYAPVGLKTRAPYTTFYQSFVGPGAFFEGKTGLKITSITDGTSNTLMVVEGEEPVPWTKPDDLPFDPKKPLPRVGG